MVIMDIEWIGLCYKFENLNKALESADSPF